ncbi:tail fiber domain-containing protein [Ichthyenterobacterium magnum]|uniref:Trimeric autotransporter adhesin n=1 Tax=Ichthyenterobacterium magnum TaxID=1230530 RepID=A0A420DL87_9FLAO|nr:tail fiber domain-containing protein [Ichthyenterobacterium magnum]RKE95036.1 trimeric autotransporter adhesin [Ichthyenterobacterium magnum]
MDEGNGIGWRLIGRNPNLYGNIGRQAVDLSFSNDGVFVFGALADYSTAIGFNVSAESYASTVIGRRNEGGGTLDSWVETDPLFEIGNGTFLDRSNALTILKNGTITAPSFDISEITNPKALITKEFADANYSGGGSGTEPSGLEALDEGEGIGWRLIGSDPNNFGDIGEFAIDLSFAEDSSTTNGATGFGAIAIGNSVSSTGAVSTAIGIATSSSGIGSTAMGAGTIASGDYSTALGNSSTAAENHTTAIGYLNNASALGATAIGYQTSASGVYATATGHGTIAEGWYSFTSGRNTLASGSYSVSMGQATTASGFYSFAIGDGTKAESLGSTAIGHFNLGGGTPNTMVSTDPLFEIGNGSSDIARSNALTIYRNGNATLAGTLTQNSDRRLKTNIKELQYGLQTILNLNPVSYNWKRYPEETQQSLGLIAQEVQPLIEEIVKIGIDKDQTLSLSYTELIPILIKAMQEQQTLINTQEKQIEGLSAELIKFKEFDQRIKKLEALNTNTLEK